MNSKWINHGSYSEDATINLFCFCHAGGSSSFYAPWKRFFKEEINLLPVEYPMREKRFKEEMYEDLPRLAKDFVEENEFLLTQKDVALLGHCTGALVAYEAEKYMEKRFQQSAKVLFVSEAFAPEINEIDPVSEMTEEQFIDYVKASGVINPLFLENEEMMEYFIPMAMADFIMHEKYQDKERKKIEAPIVLLKGEKGMEDLENEKYTGWSEYTQSDFSKKTFAGDHFYLQSQTENVVTFLKEALQGGIK